MRSWPDLPALESQPLDRQTVESHDAAILVTDHAAVDYELLADAAALIVDTRGVLQRATGTLVKA